MSNILYIRGPPILQKSRRLLNLDTLLTQWSWALLEMLISSQLVKKYPTFHETSGFITAFTSAHHISLSSVTWIQSIPPHLTSWRPILILTSIYTWVSQVVSIPQVSPPKPCIHISFPHTCHMPRPSHSSRFDHPNNIGWGVQIIKLFIM